MGIFAESRPGGDRCNGTTDAADEHPVDAEPFTSAALGLGGRTPLWLAGVMPARPTVAIVGSRAASRVLREAVEPIVAGASALGWSVCSGGALGIDADAHRAALAAGVPQVAVLPCGSDRCYPREHAPLFERIVEAGGGVLYCHPPGSEFCRAQFASRNRWVVAAADAVVVIQAATRSGSKLTGRMALDRGMPVAVLPGSPGAAVLAAGGAYALDWPSPPDALARQVERWLQGRIERAPPAWPGHLEPVLLRLQEAGPRGLSADALGWALLPALTEAEADGWAVEVSPGRYVLGSRSSAS